MNNPKINISKLRDIGWSLWDPLELLPEGESWNSEDNLAFADEYDDYLMKAAGKIRNGVAKEEVVGYLLDVENKTLGLKTNADSKKRIQEVVASISEDDELWSD